MLARRFPYAVYYEFDINEVITLWRVLDLSSITGATSVTFRLYGFNSEATGGTGGLQGNLTFSGTVVPEPSTYAAMLGLLALGVVMWRRRRR